MYHDNQSINQSILIYQQITLDDHYSPPGHGLDCHRTWEALSMGCIVLVQASPMDDLFTNLQLPVVPLANLSEWAALEDPKRLEAIVDAYAPWTEPAHLAPRLSVRNLLNLDALQTTLMTAG